MMNLAVMFKFWAGSAFYSNANVVYDVIRDVMRDVIISLTSLPSDYTATRFSLVVLAPI